MDKVRCIIGPHADFSIEWDSDFEGSVSTTRLLEGRVLMKYSSVPRFIFELSKNFDSFDFLNQKQKKEILECEKVSFADSEYKEIAARSKSDTEFFRGVWNGFYIDSNGKRKEWGGEKLEIFRDGTYMTKIIEILKSEGIKNVEYSGIVDAGSEYKILLHILASPEKEIYITQHWQHTEILKTKENQTKEIVDKIVRLYGVAVSGSLRSLLER